MNYEIDHLDESHLDVLNKDRSYVVVIDLPYCSVTGPFRITTETLKQALTWKNRRRITNIKMWGHNKFREPKKKVVNVKPNPIKIEDIPDYFMFWNRILFESLLTYGTY